MGRNNRWFLAFGSGAVLAVFAVIVIAVGGMITAVSNERTVDIPLLLTAHSGTGQDLLSVDLNPVGLLVWLLALTVLVGLPIGLTRRRTSANGAP
ncbi:hypothetical protein [Dactylosporangium sp. CA-233914]|uniref:hypothetical protein n=1 Tax=Dactylosporangium sp. CA-233914 TaxID=3239934 RepID=UPI003D8A54BE